ncbi:hypothetical protein KAI78_06155 [bacterium]|nr:hypothetical protein [bacterium]
MIDIHSHIIPGIDDGSKSLGESFKYLKTFKQLGFKGVVLTPHFYPGFFETSPEKTLKLTKEIASYMKKYFQDSMEFFPGTEVYLSEETLDLILQKKVLTMNNNGRYILFETDFSFILPNLEEMIKVLQHNGYMLIWAHPERNTKICENPEILKTYIDLDVLTQMNLGSLAGQFGGRIQHTAKHLLQSDMIHFIGTDCHCDGKRGNYIKDALEVFEDCVNPELKDIILETYPKRMLAGEIIYPFPYKNVRKSRMKRVLNFFGIGK